VVVSAPSKGAVCPGSEKTEVVIRPKVNNCPALKSLDGRVAHRLSPRWALFVCMRAGPLSLALEDKGVGPTLQLEDVFKPARRSLSLLLLTTARPVFGLEDVGAVAEGTLPTQSRHSRASPSARSQRPISRGGSPDNLAQARLE